MSVKTPVGRIHEGDNAEGYRLLKKAHVDNDGDAKRIAKSLGMSIYSVYAWQRKYPDLRAVAREARVKAAKRELRGE